MPERWVRFEKSSGMGHRKTVRLPGERESPEEF